MAVDITLDDAAFQRAMSKMIADAEVAAQQVVTLGGRVIESHAKAKAAGRPGPNVVTGSHRRSIGVHSITSTGAEWESQTGPTMIYSRVLELGFDGVDSAGRVRHQPPYPSLGPGLEAAAGDLAALSRKTYGRVVGV